MPLKWRKVLSRRIRAFGYAFAGWWYVVRTQPNMWIHAIAAALVVFLAWWLHLPARDWAVLVLTIVVVLIAEMGNTAIEAVVDMVMPDEHPLAGAAKDVAAGAVLTAAAGSVFVGLLILGPPLWTRLFG